MTNEELVRLIVMGEWEGPLPHPAAEARRRYCWLLYVALFVLGVIFWYLVPKYSLAMTIAGVPLTFRRYFDPSYTSDRVIQIVEDPRERTEAEFFSDMGYVQATWEICRVSPVLQILESILFPPFDVPLLLANLIDLPEEPEGKPSRRSSS